jgi:tetratricopeptide (TPR) repeat protein
MIRAITLLALASVGTAHADGTVDPATQARADALFEKAQAHFQADEFQAAIELFKSAYELVHDPVYLFNLAQSERKILDCVAAADYYKRYLDAAPDAPNKDKVEGWIRELTPCVDQRTAEHDAVVREQEARDRAAREAAARKPPPARVFVDEGATYRLAGEVTGAVGVVGLALGIGFAAHGSSLGSSLTKECATGCNWDTASSEDSAGHRANTIAAVGFIGGGLAVLAGAGLYYYGTTRAAVEVTPTSVVARVSF